MNNPVNRIDTDGNFSIAICVILGFTVGAFYSLYEDYRDDYKVNGSIGWKTYNENMLFGSIAGLCIGSIGAVMEYAIPVLNTFFNTTFTIGSSIGVSSGAATLTSSVTITGAEILIGASAAFATVTIAMAKLKQKSNWKSGGYKFTQYPNDHNPLHIHVSGGDLKKTVKIGIDGNPINNDSYLTPHARKVIKRMIKRIKKALMP